MKELRTNLSVILTNIMESNDLLQEKKKKIVFILDYRTRPNDMVHTSDIAKTKWSTEATINADKKIQASGNSKNTRINNILISDEGKWKSKSLAIFCAQSCLTLCDPMDCSPSGSSVHGVFQARILEQVAISFSRGLPSPGIEPTSAVSPALQVDSLLLNH